MTGEAPVAPPATTTTGSAVSGKPTSAPLPSTLPYPMPQTYPSVPKK
jgi:hypothetical protein